MSFPKTRPQRASFIHPEEGESVGINPPGFSWWRAEGAASYRFMIQDDSGDAVYEAGGLTDPVHVPGRVLAPGSYCWKVLAQDGSGKTLDTWGERDFSVPEGVPEQPWISAEELLGRVPREHPRVIFLAEDQDDLRASVSGARRQPVGALLKRVDEKLSIDLPEHPDYDKHDDRYRRRMAYLYYFRDFRGYIDGGMEPLALAYLFTGEKRYGEAAVKLLTHVAAWDPEGLTSILSPHGDEAGLSLVKTGAHCYDWLYDLMDDSQRALVKKMLVARADQMLRRLVERHDFLAFPEESHAGRLPGYLCEHAIALVEEPEARTWLDYALRAIFTVFPHWGGRDGGWAQGIGYGRAYNMIALAPFEAVKAATGLDLWSRPVFRKVRRFFFYCASPVGEIAPFGDGGLGPKGRSLAPLMIHHAQRFADPAVRWWAEQASPEGRTSPVLANLILPDEVKPEPPQGLAPDAVFTGVGWAALHGELADPAKDTFVLFKSSPYGSVSHSHADQNAFVILKGGKALAISSGYYGPGYGMPHHVEWTRQTKAHCCILVDGVGQVAGSAESRGRIVDFRSTEHIGYVCGDAAGAYGPAASSGRPSRGRLERFLRHVLLVRPGLVCVLDELAAPGGASFQWLLHAFEPFDLAAGRLDEAEQTVVSERDGARMTVRLHTPGGFDFSQTDLFDTPYNEKNPPEFHEDRPNHFHFRASTCEKAAVRRIAAFAVIEGPGERFDCRHTRPAPGWVGVEVEFGGGTACVVAQVEPGAAPPDGVPAGAPLVGSWTPSDRERGEAEELVGLST